MQQARTFRAEKTVGVVQNHEDGTGPSAMAGRGPKSDGGDVVRREWTLGSTSVEGTPSNPTRGARGTPGQGGGAALERSRGQDGREHASREAALADGLRNTSQAHPVTGERQGGSGEGQRPATQATGGTPATIGDDRRGSIAIFSIRDGFHEP